MVIDKIALVLAIIGALNWGAIGLFGFDAVAFFLRRPDGHPLPHHLRPGGFGGPVVHHAAVPRRRGDRARPYCLRSGQYTGIKKEGPSAPPFSFAFTSSLGGPAPDP